MHNAVYYLLAISFLGLTSAHAETEQPPRSNIALKNARFQSLPREVQRVYVGPDGRIWYQLDPAQMNTHGATADNIPAFRERMAAEFTQKSPQFYGAQLALFEPGGRVWFFFPQHCLLLGYDGKQWTEYVIPDANDRILGYCPTRGSCTAGRANRFAGDAAWFVCARGILRFDGKNWSHQVMLEKPQPNPGITQGNILLTTSPDGRTVAACAATSSKTVPEYWLFQNGQWTAQKTAAADPQNPGGNRRLMSIALSDANTLWLVYNNGQMECVCLGGETAPCDAKDISDLIDQLADDSFATRQRATRELLALGSSIKPQIENALKQQPDAEQDYRLKLILQSFQPKPATPGSLPSADFGGVQVVYARQLFQDPTGKVGVIAQSIREGRSRQGPGVALLDGSKQAKLILSKNPGFSGFNYQNENLPVYTASARKSWWPRNLTGESVQLYDAAIDEFIDAAPVPLYGSIQAVSAEGRVFLTKIAVGAPGEPIMVYTPDAPETRTILKMEKTPAFFPQFALTDGGALWTVIREENNQPRQAGNWGGKLARYDGKTWTTPDAQPSQMVQSMTPGKGATLLVQNQLESILYRGAKEIASGDLVEMIEKNRETFRTSFGPGMPASSFDLNQRQTNQVLADKAGNIWRLEAGGRLLVLVGDRWQLAHESLVAAGSSGGMASYIMPLGDGRKIYGGDRNAAPGRLAAFLGEVQDGKLRFSEAPRIEPRDNDSLKVRDADGSLWAVCLLKEPNGGLQQKIVCLGPDGVREKLDLVGNPKLVDAAGNLWVEKNILPAGGTYKLWRKGQWGQEITIPNVTRTTRLFSDRPGSVYLWTSEGLQQFVADAPDYKEYRPGQLYSIDNLSGEVLALSYSKQGFLVLLMQGTASNTPWAVGIAKLPEEKSEPAAENK